ncbi:MAG: hypothetical protein SVZ03_14855 [Spirochaetota bacterium]|nr:hypothetical protein [Spirochaetota bacterium]
MNLQDIKNELSTLRDEWRRVRRERINKMKELLTSGMNIREIRSDSIYKDLKKRQERLSKDIRHKEKILNRKIALNRRR